VTIATMRAIAGDYARNTIRRRLQGGRAPGDPPVETSVVCALDRLRDTGTRLVLAFSGDEGLHAELEAYGVLARLEQWPTVELALLPGRDHTLRPMIVQRAVHELLDRQLAIELAGTGLAVGGAGSATRDRKA
jgi:hypothetical protein